MMVYQLPLTKIHLFNVLTQLLFDFAVVKVIGANALIYLIMSSFLAGSLHPCAGHFIAEHYVFEKKERLSQASKSSSLLPETYSYYGTLNLLTYNVGLHNEHHDFPAIPWTRLPILHEIAKEFYSELPISQKLDLCYLAIHLGQGDQFMVSSKAGRGWTKSRILENRGIGSQRGKRKHHFWG